MRATARRTMKRLGVAGLAGLAGLAGCMDLKENPVSVVTPDALGTPSGANSEQWIWILTTIEVQ